MVIRVDELQASYANAVTTWRQLRATHPALSAPLVVAPGTAYAATKTRLMIVGQETLGWGENCDVGQPVGELVEVLEQWYRAFDLGAKYRSTPFWNAADQLFRRLNPETASRSFIWSNLVKMDSGGRRPPPVVDVNRATAAELERLPRVGPALARRIVAWRETHGRFQSIDDLRHVRGIGPATAALLAQSVTF